MTRRCVLVLAVGLSAVALLALPAAAVTVNGGVVGSYEYYDANQGLGDDAEIRLRQSYLLNAAGDLWAPEVASYRSAIRYDIVTQSLEDIGGASSDGVRSLDLEGRLFPYSPINLTVGAHVNSVHNEHPELGGSTTNRDELGLYGRFWLDFAGLPATTVNVSHESAAASKNDLGGVSEIEDATTDRVSVSALLRKGTAQTQLRLQADQKLDHFLESGTFQRAASLEYTNAPTTKLLIRAGADVSSANAYKPTETAESSRQKLYLRTRYQLGAADNIQVALSGETGTTTASQTSESRNLLMNTQYTRALGRALQGIVSADYSRVDTDDLTHSAATAQGRASVRAQVGSVAASRLNWLGAATVESVETMGNAKPGAVAEGRIDYRLNPAVNLGVGTTLYRCLRPENAGLSDDVSRVGLQGNLRWLGGKTGRVALSLSGNARQYPTTKGADGYASLSAGVSPRGDLDLSSDLTYSASETPTVDLGVVSGHSWQRYTALSGVATFRPRSDFTLSLTVSSQITQGPAVVNSLQQIGQLKAEYLFYALRFVALGKVIQTDDVRSLEASVSVRRDF